MHTFFGILMIAIGLLMWFWGTTKSEFVLYRILTARSKAWGANVHRFYQFSGLAIVVVGALMTLKVIGN